MSKRKRRGGSRTRARRTSKPRNETTNTTTPAPSRRRRKSTRQPAAWLMSRQDIDELARRRCLLVLSLLSGECTMTEACAATQCSQGTLQGYERRALEAMVAALMPDASSDGVSISSSQRIAELEAQVKHLEQGKRRAERLLVLTRQLVKPGPVTTGAGRRPGSRSRPKSERNGANNSERRSATKTASTKKNTTTSASTSTLPATTDATSTPTPSGAER